MHTFALFFLHAEVIVDVIRGDKVEKVSRNSGANGKYRISLEIYLTGYFSHRIRLRRDAANRFLM